MHQLTVTKLAKRFGERRVFSDLQFDLTTGQSLAVVGHNGSGKSTLIKTLLGLFHPNRGKIEYREDDQPMDDAAIRAETAFVAPYLNLYDHLTAEENLKFFATVGGLAVTGKQINELLARVGLEGRGLDLVAGYSSGMKQRLKYAVAIQKEPGFLFLDEPTSNLDEAGKSLVREIVDQFRSKAVIIVATNETEEYSFAEAQCRVGG